VYYSFDLYKIEFTFDEILCHQDKTVQILFGESYRGIVGLNGQEVKDSLNQENLTRISQL
jgi:hypothetical protein